MSWASRCPLATSRMKQTQPEKVYQMPNLRISFHWTQRNEIKNIYLCMHHQEIIVNWFPLPPPCPPPPPPTPCNLRQLIQQLTITQDQASQKTWYPIGRVHRSCVVLTMVALQLPCIKTTTPVCQLDKPVTSPICNLSPPMGHLHDYEFVRHGTSSHAYLWYIYIYI